MELTSCTVIENIDDLDDAELSDLGANPGDIRNCTLIYPSRAYIIVIDADQTEKIVVSYVADDSYQDWLWYVILAAIIVLAGLSYIAYVWWRNKKMKEADVAQVRYILMSININNIYNVFIYK